MSHLPGRETVRRRVTKAPRATMPWIVGRTTLLFGVFFVLGFVSMIAFFSSPTRTVDEASVAVVVPITVFFLFPYAVAIVFPPPRRPSGPTVLEQLRSCKRRDIALLGSAIYAMTIAAAVLCVLGVVAIASAGLYALVGLSWAVRPAEGFSVLALFALVLYALLSYVATFVGMRMAGIGVARDVPKVVFIEELERPAAGLLRQVMI